MADKFLSSDELRNLSDKELENELKTARQNLNATQIAVNTTKEKAVHKIKNLRKYVARVLTIMKEIATKEAESKKEAKSTK